MKQAKQAVIAAALFIASMGPVTAFAQMGYHDYRHIHVNGEHYNEQQIRALDRILGYEVPSGFHLVDFERGVWAMKAAARSWARSTGLTTRGAM